MEYKINTEILAKLVKSKRGRRGLREISKEIGSISASAISQVEKGKMPKTDDFLALCKWLDIKPSDVLVSTSNEDITALMKKIDTKNFSSLIENKSSNQDNVYDPDVNYDDTCDPEDLPYGANGENWGVACPICHMVMSHYHWYIEGHNCFG